MAKGKAGAPAPKVQSGANRPNGKAVKKNPGPAQPERTNFDHINGRSSKSHALREAWKKTGGRWNHTSIPHWKTGKVYQPSSIAPAFDPSKLEAIASE